ncbi:MAG: hypothetical protein BWY96_01287 [Spirochaetes bacterium ADurb.BinA120]|nr:MAG: hypothetical protein BWY96_01287 [Spirochaetes bacterium ADurb.BinA120]
MVFEKIIKSCRFLDPFQSYAPVEKTSEVRVDPLTGSTSRILDFPVKQLEKQDFGPIAEGTRQYCPFCPSMVEQITPKFDPSLVPEERYKQGEAICFPNAFPYDENGAVTVMSREHYIPIDGFSIHLIRDALECSARYLADLLPAQPEVVYQSINWNFLPLAGSSLVHPHLQVMSSSTATNYYATISRALKNYVSVHDGEFWTDLISEEEKIGERFIGNTDSVSWLTAFAPMGAFDVLGVLPRISAPAEIIGASAEEIAGALVEILRFMGSLNITSFNMAFYFKAGVGSFTPHIRLCPRIALPPLGTSEINYMKMLHGEPLTTMKPEDICLAIRDAWRP